MLDLCGKVMNIKAFKDVNNKNRIKVTLKVKDEIFDLDNRVSENSISNMFEFDAMEGFNGYSEIKAMSKAFSNTFMYIAASDATTNTNNGKTYYNIKIESVKFYADREIYIEPDYSKFRKYERRVTISME